MKALQKAKELSLESFVVITDNEKSELKKANKYHKENGFEYFINYIIYL